MGERRPRIGITPQWKTQDVSLGIPRVDLNSCYPRAVWAAGGLPLVLVPHEDPSSALECVETIDGLLLTGGDDIDPRRYGQEPHGTIKPLPRVRDVFDLALLEAALRRGLPILGTCLGHQQINIHLGGTLHQYLPDVIERWTVEHRWIERDREPLPRHEIEIEPGSRLARVLGETRIDANSSHRQAVWEVGEGLRVVARADDGVVEGVESVDSDQILAVQWHPEEIHEEPVHFALFRDIVERARRFTDGR